MNTEQKLIVLKKFISDLDSFTKTQQAHSIKITPEQIDSSNLPQIDLVGELMDHHDKIMHGVDQAYSAVSPVLGELSGLQSQKQNVNALLDSMTAIREVKQLAYGLGSSTAQKCRNLSVYYQIKDKIHYCDKHVEKVEQQIKIIEIEFRETLQRELKKVNSDNVTQIAKALNLISKHSQHSKHSDTNDQLVTFYLDVLKKDLFKFEDDLLKIPIVGNTATTSYIFFDIAKEIMKTVVSLISTYRGNIIKIGGEESLHKVIVKVFEFVMDGIILQLLMRQKKYFEMENLDSKKISKEGPKFKEYFKEFCAICNQIQRLKSHISQQLNETYPNYKTFLHQLDAAVNTSNIIALNSEATQSLKLYTRFKFNKLLKNSPFITSIWQFEYEFLQKISENGRKNGNSVYQCQEGHQFLIETYSIFTQAIEQCLETLNVLIISSMISFTNNNLIQEDSFHGFNELFDRILSRMPSAQIKYNTGIVILINSVLMMPNALRSEMGQIKIPEQIEEFRTRLESQLRELVEICEFKVKATINSFISSIISANWFCNQLRNDYKKQLEKWKGMTPDASQLFFNKCSQAHADLIIREQFNVKKSSKLLTQQGIINFEKEVRGIISFYENKGCSILQNFKRVLAYIEVLLAENEQKSEKLMKNFGIEDKGEVDMLISLRCVKLG